MNELATNNVSPQMILAFRIDYFYHYKNDKTKKAKGKLMRKEI